MAGYSLEFKRNYSPALTKQQHQVFAIGQVDSANIVDSTTNELSVDTTPKGNIEIAASQVQPPRISENFLAPVNDVREPLYDPPFDYLYKFSFRPPTRDAKSGP